MNEGMNDIGLTVTAVFSL